jgi:hypothetical protein
MVYHLTERIQLGSGVTEEQSVVLRAA